MTGRLRLRRTGWLLLPILALAACADGGSTSASSDTSSTSSGGSTSTSAASGGSTGGTGGSGTGATTTTSTSSGQEEIPPLQLVAVDGTYDAPLFVTSSPGDDTRLFIVEQTGAIRLVKNGALLPTPFVVWAGRSTGSPRSRLWKGVDRARVRPMFRSEDGQ